jgi:pyridoxal phosphate enzyme (YggS family)
MTSREAELRVNLGIVQERLFRAAREVGRDPEEITLIAVTKFFPVSDIAILYELGIRNFGENRDGEGEDKSSQLPSDVTWHFQGQVQSRKIKSIATWADCIHSLDSLDHAEKFEKVLATMGSRKDLFIQVNLEPERVDRGGVPVERLPDFLHEVRRYSNLNIQGFMAVLPVASDPKIAFAQVASLASDYGFSKLSLGMSNDFEEAIKAGATHIRVGSSILGSRAPLA